LLEVLGALGLLDSGDWERFGKGKCEHVSSLAVLLGDALNTPAAAASEKFVVVLDGIDRQREASHTLLAALARLGEVVSLYSCDYAFFFLAWKLFFITAHYDTSNI
jgi:origin recognition complex subunit 5